MPADVCMNEHEVPSSEQMRNLDCWRESEVNKSWRVCDLLLEQHKNSSRNIFDIIEPIVRAQAQERSGKDRDESAVDECEIWMIHETLEITSLKR